MILNIKRFIATAILMGSLWMAYYLILRPYEYEVNFRTHTNPGDVIQVIRFWNRSLDSAQIVRVDSFDVLHQVLTSNGNTYDYFWRFEVANDSLTKVNIRISQKGRELRNKLLVPFTQQSIEADASSLVTNLYSALEQHLAMTTVDVVGETFSDSTFCVCASLSTNQIEKANGMMASFGPLTSFINVHRLISQGPPLVHIKKWNHSEGKLQFDFCFPIQQSDSLPPPGEFQYRNIPGQRALKARYTGNYMNSDRAWYHLMNYASDQGYSVGGLPIEQFHDNPTLGVNEEEWRADIYLPLN